MKKTVFNLEFITPAFLAGANQNHAEVRAASIRGQLRWWFRVLDGEPREERAVFGGVHGTPDASKIVVRVRDVKPVHQDLPRYSPMSDFGYLYYFASVAGNREGVHRTHKDAFFSPGTKFSLEILERRPLTAVSRARFDMALSAFVRLGSFGLRATRGCGAMTEVDKPLSKGDLLDWAKSLPKIECRLMNDVVYQDWRQCQESLGGWLRQFRKDRHLSGKSDKSALGFSSGREREASALRLRPVKVREGFLPVLVYSDAACSQASLAGTF
jgi:CRISPR-associated protein Cmr1